MYAGVTGTRATAAGVVVAFARLAALARAARGRARTVALLARPEGCVAVVGGTEVADVSRTDSPAPVGADRWPHPASMSPPASATPSTGPASVLNALPPLTTTGHGSARGHEHKEPFGMMAQ